MDKDQAAILIQKCWRGYRTRSLDQNVLSLVGQLNLKRTNELVQFLAQEMLATKEALQNERRLQLLQTKAIHSLWKKVVSLELTQCSTCGGYRSTTADKEIQTDSIEERISSQKDVVDDEANFAELLLQLRDAESLPDELFAFAMEE
ncbi:unnamed protein product [Nesidiocoris tenuis]|uniref:Uncharacterized protein n=1 Tax=Nesidiocoris tenuis TaxID=355587 RepID=A0A6H5G0W4_9HEMI|nr:unnamed protein product [Nesidiocoris tenuis]